MSVWLPQRPSKYAGQPTLERMKWTIWGNLRHETKSGRHPVPPASAIRHPERIHTPYGVP